MSRLAVFLLFAVIGADAANVSITIQSNATFDANTDAFAGSGTGTLSGYGPGTLKFANNPPSTTIVTFALDFGSGNILQGTMTPTAGTLPGPGGTSTGALSLAVTGGTGIFAGATGSFPSVKGTATSTCSPCDSSAGTFIFNLSGAGTLTLAVTLTPRVSLGNGTLAVTGAAGQKSSAGPAYVQNPGAFAFALTDGVNTITGQERNNSDPVGGPDTALQTMTTFDGRKATISGTISNFSASDVAGSSGGSQVFAIGLVTRGILQTAATTSNSELNLDETFSGTLFGPNGFDGVIIGYDEDPSPHLYFDAFDLGRGAGQKVGADLIALGDASGQTLTKPLNFSIAFDGANMTVTLNGATLGSIPFTHDLSNCVLAAMASSLNAGDGKATMTYSNLVAATPSTVGPPSLLYPVSGDQQTAPAGMALSAPLVVGLVDAYRNPVPGVTVSFTATNAAITPQSAQTDSSGHATAQVTLGNAPGAATVTATVNGIPAVTFDLTANAPPPNITGVVNGASFQSGIAAATWVTIQGTNLSPTRRQWQSSDFVGDALPTQLDHVSVTVNGKPAYVYYISDAQLNVLAPDDPATGPVAVQVTNPLGASNTFTANKASLAPALFLFTSKYPAAVHLNGVYIGPPGLIPGAVTEPAHPNETVVLFGTGFGATNPPTATGEEFTPAPPLAESVTVTVGGMPATAQAYLISPGLYQFNITLPALPDGDAPVVIAVGGDSTQQGLVLTIAH